MKKSIFALLLAVAVATVSCTEVVNKINEYEKGKIDADAFCECTKKLTDIQCLAKMDNILKDPRLNLSETDPTKWSEYQAGFMVKGTACLLEYNGND